MASPRLVGELLAFGLALALVGLFVPRVYAAETRGEYCRSAGAAAPSVIGALEDARGPASVTTLGAGAETLLVELLGRVCGTAAVRTRLSHVCAMGSGAEGPALEQLRTRLLRDLLAAPQGLLADTAELSVEERAALALLGSLVGSLEPAEVAHRFALGLSLVPDAQCAAPTGAPRGELELAAHLFWQVSQSRSEPSRGALGALVATSLEQAGRGDALRDPLVERRIATLVEQARSMHEAWQAASAEPRSAEHAEQVWRSEFQSVAAALSLARACLSPGEATPEVALPNELFVAVLALLQGDPQRALEQLEVGLRRRYPEALTKAARTLLAFAEADTLARAERIVRGRVLGLPAWTDDVVLSVSVGVPSFTADHLDLLGEATVGYDSRRFGLLADGYASLYSLDVPDTSQSETLQLDGNLDLRLGFPVSDSVTLELAATSSASLFDTQTVIFDETRVYDEDALLLRGGGLLGVRVRRPNWRLGLWFGGSAQLESYGVSTLSVDAGDASGQITESDTLGVMGEVRAFTRYNFWPGVFALHVDLRGRHFTLSRVASELTVADVSQVQIDERSRQLEAAGRAFVDVDALRFFDFLPGVGVGVDYFQLSIAGQATRATTVPLYSVGVRRQLD